MKITLSRIFETSRALQTKAGQELSDLVSFFSDFVELVLRCLRKGLTFGDNFNCDVVSVEVLNNTITSIGQRSGVTGIIPLRVQSTIYGLESFSWYVDTAGQTQVRATFNTAIWGAVPDPTTRISITLVVLYG